MSRTIFSKLLPQVGFTSILKRSILLRKHSQIIRTSISNSLQSICVKMNLFLLTLREEALFTSLCINYLLIYCAWCLHQFWSIGLLYKSPSEKNVKRLYLRPRNIRLAFIIIKTNIFVQDFRQLTCPFEKKRKEKKTRFLCIFFSSIIELYRYKCIQHSHTKPVCLYVGVGGGAYSKSPNFIQLQTLSQAWFPSLSV